MKGLFVGKPGKVVRDELTQYLKGGDVFRTRRRSSLFICGGPVNDESTLRSQFLAHAKVNLPAFDFFLAEKATADIIEYDEPQPIDLGEFEQLIADIADCVLVFPESVGSYVELGFFSTSREALPKLLLANDAAHQGYSFINEGPKRWIDRESTFNGTLYIDYDNPGDREKKYNDLCQRVNHRLGGKKTKKKFSVDRFNRMAPREQLLVTLSIIDILRIPSLHDIYRALRSICGGVQGQELRIRRLLSILRSANLIVRVGEEGNNFVARCDSTNYLVAGNRDPNAIRARALEYIQHHHSEWHSVFVEKSYAAEHP